MELQKEKFINFVKKKYPKLVRKLRALVDHIKGGSHFFNYGAYQPHSDLSL